MTHTSTDVSYFHELMEETAINDGVYGVEYPVTCNVAPVYEGITGALDIIRNVAHFYTMYVFVPGVSTFDEPPSTPTFTKVLLRSNDSVDTVARDNQRKHIGRSRMTPPSYFSEWDCSIGTTSFHIVKYSRIWLEVCVILCFNCVNIQSDHCSSY